MIKQGIVALLGTCAPLTALISTRLYPVILPPEQSVYPALAYTVVSGPPPEWSLPGTQKNQLRIQLDAYAESYAAADEVLAAVFDQLNGFAGPLAGGARIIFSQALNPADHFEDNARIYRSIQEYEIEYVEPNH